MPTFLLLYGIFVWLLSEFTPIEKGIDFLSDNIVWFLGGFLVFILLYGLYSFVNWLFIEPYKNYRKRVEDKYEKEKV